MVEVPKIQNEAEKILERTSKLGNSKIRKKLEVLGYLMLGDVLAVTAYHVQPIISVYYYRMWMLRRRLGWVLTLDDDEEKQWHKFYVRELEAELYDAKDSLNPSVYLVGEAINWIGNAIKRWLGE